MGNWRRLILPTAQIMTTYQQMQPATLKEHAGKDIVFEDQRKEAILAAIFIARTFFEQINLKVKYRGLENLRGRRVAFVANHQGGNLDAMVISSILFAEQSRVPFIPTSDRLLEAHLIGQFNEYLKYVGPFFIRSSFNNDQAYMAQVLKLMDAILDARQYLLFFLEGDTSKGGKPRPPKRGLIKSLTHTSVTFCPVSITYESALNDNGIRKKALHVHQVVQNFTQRQVGTCYVTFGECIDSDPSDPFQCHKALTEQLSAAIYSEIPILTVDLIATVLLDRDELTLKELDQRVQELESLVRRRHLPLVSKDTGKALEAIKHLLTEHTGSKKYSVRNPVVLNFYRNRALQAFFDLAQPPSLLKYECCWRPCPYLLQPGDERIRDLAVRMLAPLLAAYETVISHIGLGTTKEVLWGLLAENPNTTCCTLDNILLVLQEAGTIRVEGHDILPV